MIYNVEIGQSYRRYLIEFNRVALTVVVQNVYSFR